MYAFDVSRHFAFCIPPDAARPDLRRSAGEFFFSSCTGGGIVVVHDPGGELTRSLCRLEHFGDAGAGHDPLLPGLWRFFLTCGYGFYTYCTEREPQPAGFGAYAQRTPADNSAYKRMMRRRLDALRTRFPDRRPALTAYEAPIAAALLHDALEGAPLVCVADGAEESSLARRGWERIAFLHANAIITRNGAEARVERLSASGKTLHETQFSFGEKRPRSAEAEAVFNRLLNTIDL